MKIKVYNQDGNVTSEIKTPKFLLSSWNPSLVHQVFKIFAANKRRPVAHTKIRSEVRGGGKKPWRQKGTGRARHGSIRSPLWRGGGVTFGPRNDKDFSRKANKKMIRNALQVSLSKKSELGELKIVDNFNINNLKTKDFSRIVRNLAGKRPALIVISNENKNALRFITNIPKTKGVYAKNINIYDVLIHKYVLIDKAALEQFPH